MRDTLRAKICRPTWFGFDVRRVIKLSDTNRREIRFIYDNWAGIATGIVILSLTVPIGISLFYPPYGLPVYLFWGVLLLGILALVRPLLGILAGVHLDGNSESQPGPSDSKLTSSQPVTIQPGDPLYLEDWKMTKDRIKHFDNMVITIRTQGVPVATAILAAGLIASQTLKSIPVDLAIIKVSSLSLVFASSALLITAIGLLDLLHYNLLLLAVGHAWKLETRPEFKGKLQITHKLTSPLLTYAHSLAAAVIYVSLAGTAIYLSFSFAYSFK